MALVMLTNVCSVARISPQHRLAVFSLLSFPSGLGAVGRAHPERHPANDERGEEHEGPGRGGEGAEGAAVEMHAAGESVHTLYLRPL